MPSLRVASVAALVALSAIAAGLAGTGSKGAPADRNASAVSATTRGSRMASGGTSGVDVPRENALPGTREWRITSAAGTAPGLAAWSGTLSVRPGQPVPLHVSGSGTAQVRALRIGWYGGTGARQVWQGTLTATPGAADPASWPVSARPATTGWPPGHYLLRLDLGAASRYVPLTVRSAGASGDVLLVTSPLTWQASDGAGDTGSPGRAGDPRSLDRPYAQEYGAGGFLAGDAPIVQLAERDGARLAYATDADLAAEPTLMDGAAALAFGSGSQYWTAHLRTAVIATIGSGTNAAFFGAGAGTRRVELAGPRALVMQQSVPAATTALTGLIPICPASGATAPPSLTTGTRSWVVQEPTWWGYRDASVSAGQRFPGLVSTGADGGLPTSGTAASGTAVSGTAVSGRAVEVLAQSPGTCAGDGPIGRAAGPATGGATGPQQAVYWTNSAGAAVFSTGTSRWACVALGACPGAAVDRASRSFAAQVTRTVLTAFAQPAAGRTHPATP